MALYLGSNKFKVIIDNKKYKFISDTNTIVVEGIVMLTNNNFVLKDSNDIYLTLKEGE